MQIVDPTPPSGYTLTFEGQGGAAGFTKGEAKVSLAPSEGGDTALSYTAKANVGGKLAQIGSRLIDGAAAKMADDFFARFAQRVAPPEEVTAAPAHEAGRFGLPCGGTIQLVTEPLTRESGMRALLREVEGGHLVTRRLDLASGFATLHPANAVDGLVFDGKTLTTIHGPRYR